MRKVSPELKTQEESGRVGTKDGPDGFRPRYGWESSQRILVQPPFPARIVHGRLPRQAREYHLFKREVTPGDTGEGMSPRGRTGPISLFKDLLHDVKSPRWLSTPLTVRASIKVEKSDKNHRWGGNFRFMEIDRWRSLAITSKRGAYENNYISRHEQV